MKNRMNTSCSAVWILLMFAGSGINRAFAAEWDGGGRDQKFTTAENWSHDAVPTAADVLIVDGTYTPLVESYAVCDRLSLMNGAVLTLIGGTLDCGAPGNTRVDIIGAGSAGTVNQSGGTYTIGHRFHIGSGSGGKGIYNLTDGALLVFRGGRSGIDQAMGNASLELGGGGASGVLNISGGSVMTRGGATIGDKGVFSVQGTGASQIGIGSDNNVDGHWNQLAGGILRVGIDETPVGVTKIFIDHVDGTGTNGDVTFQEGALLDVRFLGEKKRGSFVVMEWEGSVTDKGLKFAPDVNTNVWDFYIDEEKKCLVVESFMKKPLGFLISMN